MVIIQASQRNATTGHVPSYKNSFREFDRERQLLIDEWTGLLDEYRAGLDPESYSTREEDIWNRYASLRDNYRELGLHV